MSTSTNSRTLLQGDRKSIQPERPDGHRPRSPQSTLSKGQKRRAPTSSNTQSRDAGERRIERITTRETITAQIRSPRANSSNVASQTTRHKAIDSRNSFRTGSARTTPDISAATILWQPNVKLTSHTTAPLASRMSVQQLVTQAPANIQPRSMQDMSLQEQEAAILEDFLPILLGYEGRFIRFSPTYDPNQEKERLAGPTFKTQPGLDPSLRDLTSTMLRMATHYSAIEAFVEVQSREEFGAVNHALCAAIRKLLQEYLILIAQLENQILTDSSFTLHALNLHTMPMSHQMMQLYSLAHEILKRNSLLEEDDDSEDDMDIDNILESLREGGEIGGGISGKKFCKGGSVLGLITKRQETMSGDPAARTLLAGLLRDASKPYMVMLNEWLHHGSIKDPHSEFLIKEQKSIKREKLEEDYTDEYWERRYTIRETDLPPQLESLKDKVLLAGKYLNVVRECGGVDISKAVQDVPRSFEDNRFLDNVNNAYAHANQALLKLLLTTHELPARLASMKHYFFLDQSDFFSYFLSSSDSELRKPVKAVNTSKLQSLLEIAIRQPGSVASLDPFKEDIRVEMNEISLTHSLQRVNNISGLQAGESLQAPASTAPSTVSDKDAIGYVSLQLDYKVPFPCSLVVSRKTVWRYQVLFRYLLSLRYLEQQLVASWHSHNRAASWAHRSSSTPLEPWKRRVWTLRARMLVFVQQLHYFCTSEVIEPNWQALMLRLNTQGTNINGTSEVGRTVDELMQDHVDFLDTCLKECMLTNSRLLKIHSKLMTTCTLFAQYSSWLTRELEKTDPDLSSSIRPKNMTIKSWKTYQSQRKHPANNSNATTTSSAPTSENSKEREARLEKVSKDLARYEYNFSRHLQILLDALNHYAATETVVLLGLCARLSAVNMGTEFAGREGEGGDSGI